MVRCTCLHAVHGDMFGDAHRMNSYCIIVLWNTTTCSLRWEKELGTVCQTASSDSNSLGRTGTGKPQSLTFFSKPICNACCKQDSFSSSNPLLLRSWFVERRHPFLACSSNMATHFVCHTPFLLFETFVRTCEREAILWPWTAWRILQWHCMP